MSDNLNHFRIYLQQPCETCNKPLETDTTPLTKLHQNGKFMFTAEEFTDRLGKQLDKVSNGKYKTTYIKDLSGMGPACMISETSSRVATISFIDNKNSGGVSTPGSRTNTGMLCYFYTDDALLVTETMLAVFLTNDPSMDIKEGEDTSVAVCENGEMGKNYNINGISYFLSYIGEACVMAVSFS